MMIKANEWTSLPKFIQFRRLQRAVRENRLKKVRGGI